MAPGLAKLMAPVVQVVVLLVMVSGVVQAECPDGAELSDIRTYLPFEHLYDTWTLPNREECCTKWEGVKCGPNNRVTELKLDGTLNVSGLLFPVSIFNLVYLESLFLGSYIPGLTGTLPSKLSELTNLKSLSIVGTGIYGNIPPAFGSMMSLQIFNLPNNKISGGVENLAGDDSKISFIDLNSNALSGDLPKILPSKLEHLNLAKNKYAGPINTDTAKAWSRIKYIDVSENQITGTLKDLFNAGKLTLETLKIAGNQLNFNMSAVVLPSKLTLLDVSRNRIFWLLSKQFESSKIRDLNVSDNLLMGRIPNSLKNLSAANFANNLCLCGPPLNETCVGNCFAENPKLYPSSQLLRSSI